MQEVFMFIQPIGLLCLHAEENMLKIDSEVPEKIQYQFIPVLNLHTINQLMIRNHLDQNDLALRNHLFNISYQAALDYKAALFQGKKKGRNFVMSLQHAINHNGREYSEQLVHDIAVDVKLDLEVFYLDRKSALAKEAFDEDQRITCEMEIQETPSAVVFNYCDEDYGIRVDSCSSYQLLKDVIKGKYSVTKQSLHSKPLVSSISKVKLHVL